MAVRIGFYICHCGINIANKVDVQEVAAFVRTMPGVMVSRDYQFMCSDPGQDMIIQDIQEQGLNRVVVASCSPRMHEKTFQNACSRAGLNPYLFQMTCVREHCSWVVEDPDEATHKAKHLAAAAVNRVQLHQKLYPRQKSVHPDVLVVGGGIAGMQAALDVARSGHKAYLVEKTPSVGGHMLQFDKTFPTLDCAACIGTPKMVSVGQDPNIELLTYSEVEHVDGYVGSFTVTVRQKARYITDACIGCGSCSKACPVKMPNEWDEGLKNRKAVYIPFPQAVPMRYVIDADHCIKLIKGKCGSCQKVCPAGAVDFEDKGREITLEVGSIILATGYDLMNPEQISQFGYGRFPNVLTSLEFERLNNATGPTSGEIRLRDLQGNFQGKPQSVGIIHCVGSRDSNYHEYCSRVCCMYALKYAHLIKDKLGHDVPVYNFYIDLRCFGKGYEEFSRRVQEDGVVLVRGRPAEVTDHAERPEEQDRLTVVCEDTLLGRNMRLPVDMVILCPAMEPSRDTTKLARLFSLGQGRDGFFLEEHPKLGPNTTATDGIFLAGCCQGPKDIPDSVSHASGAASKALSLATSGEVSISPTVSWIDPDICIGCQICIGLCAYGAISFDARRGVSVVNEAVCKGCGSCSGYCPSGAARVRHFDQKQVFAELEGILEPVYEMQRPTRGHPREEPADAV
ncbi:MAG: 4Fe-4S dicluster domain-containing protein [Desulfohalobiaceae bacterium]